MPERVTIEVSKNNVQTSTCSGVRSCFDFSTFRLLGVCFLTIMVVSLCASVTAAQSPVDRFLASLDADSTVPADATALIHDTWAKCKDCDGNEFLTQGLALLSPKLRRALEAYDADRYEQCAAICSELRLDPNPFVATHAAAYEIKSLVAADRLLEAGERIEQLLGAGVSPSAGVSLTAYSYFAPEVTFLRGFCLLADLQYAAADEALRRFLEDYPGAGQRLVVAAEQMRGELLNRQPGQIGEVVDLMHYSGRRLTQADTGETVRQKQSRIIEILDRMIDEAEEQESSSSSSSSSSSGGSGGRSPSQPMPDSFLPSGGGTDEGSLQARRRANPGEAWGAMPPAERERILQALRDNFPSRYRQLVEQYYEQLAKKP